MKRTPYCQPKTDSGSTPDGIKSVTFVASSDFDGTLLGQPFAAEAGLTFMGDPGDILAPIEFTVSAGTLYLYITP